MSNICLLVQDSPAIEDGNYLRIGKTLIARGHSVTCCFVDNLRLAAGRVVTSGFTLRPDSRSGGEFPEIFSLTLETQDLIWVLSLGERKSFLDKMQMLYTLHRRVRIINSLDAIIYIKSKYYLSNHESHFRYPETWASPDPDELFAVIKAQGGEWIIKPPAGSHGRDVFLVHSDDSNARAILQHLCGKDRNNYTLLQRYVSEVTQGEKRILFAAGNIIGQYRRRPGIDHRTNISQGALIETCSLTDEERIYCLQLAAQLENMGAHFAAIDLVFPWLIDVNVINPGGLITLDELTGQDHSAAIGQHLVTKLLQD